MQTETADYAKTKLSREFIDFARRQLVNATMFRTPNRRQEERFPMMLPIVAVAIDENNEPISEVFEMISRDVASATIGLFHQEPLQHDRFAIRLCLAQTMTDLAVELIWQNQMDQPPCLPVSRLSF